MFVPVLSMIVVSWHVNLETRPIHTPAMIIYDPAVEINAGSITLGIAGTAIAAVPVAIRLTPNLANLLKNIGLSEFHLAITC